MVRKVGIPYGRGRNKSKKHAARVPVGQGGGREGREGSEGGKLTKSVRREFARILCGRGRQKKAGAQNGRREGREGKL